MGSQGTASRASAQNQGLNLTLWQLEGKVVILPFVHLSSDFVEGQVMHFHSVMTCVLPLMLHATSGHYFRRRLEQRQ